MPSNGYYTPGRNQGYYTPVQDSTAQFMPGYQVQQAPQSAPQNGLLWVQGEPGAKSFFVAPGQSALLMDSEAPRFYIKTADGSGMPLPLRVFEYAEVTGQAARQPAPAMDYSQFVTRDELERRFAALTQGKTRNKKEDTENE